MVSTPLGGELRVKDRLHSRCDTTLRFSQQEADDTRRMRNALTPPARPYLGGQFMNSTLWSLIKSLSVMVAVVGASLIFLNDARAVSPAPDGGYPGNNT